MYFRHILAILALWNVIFKGKQISKICMKFFALKLLFTMFYITCNFLRFLHLQFLRKRSLNKANRCILVVGLLPALGVVITWRHSRNTRARVSKHAYTASTDYSTTLAKTHMILARKFLSQTLRVTLRVTQKTLLRLILLHSPEPQQLKRCFLCHSQSHSKSLRQKFPC